MVLSILFMVNVHNKITRTVYKLCLWHPLQCLVIGEITCEKMIVALNKIDQIDEGKRDKEIAKVYIMIYCI